MPAVRVAATPDSLRRWGNLGCHEDTPRELAREILWAGPASRPAESNWLRDHMCGPARWDADSLRKPRCVENTRTTTYVQLQYQLHWATLGLPISHLWSTWLCRPGSPAICAMNTRRIATGTQRDSFTVVQLGRGRRICLTKSHGRRNVT